MTFESELKEEGFNDAFIKTLVDIKDRNCLDKQKVKDFIKKAHIDWCNCNKKDCHWLLYFYKELELD